MFRPQYMVVENYCQHSECTINLQAGMNCLLGPNGSGKSNIVRAFYLGLTGEVYGPTNIVKYGEKTGCIKLVGQSDRGEITIERKLSRTATGVSIKHSLSCSELMEPLRKKSEVNDFMLGAIGLNTKGLEYISFARQGKFDEMIVADHAERMGMLHFLLGTDTALKLRDLAQEYVNRIPTYPDRKTEITAVTENIAKTEEAGHAAKADAASLKEFIEKGETLYAACKESITLPDAETVKASIQARFLTAEQLYNRMQEATKKRDLLQTASECIPPDDSKYADWCRMEEAKTAVNGFKKELERLSGIPVPTLPAKPAELDELDSVQVECTKLYEKLGSLTTGVCPTCKRPYDNAATPEEVQSVKSAYADAHKKASVLVGVRQQYEGSVRHAQSAIAAHEAKLSAAKSGIQTAETVMSKLEEKLKGFSVDLFRAQQAAYRDSLQKARDLAAANKEVSDATISYERANNLYETEKKTRTVTAEVYAKAKEYITLFDGKKASLAEKEESIHVLRAEYDLNRKDLKRLQSEQELAERFNKVRDTLQLARTVLHSDRLPKRCATKAVHSLNIRLRKYLMMFNFPYVFRINKDFDFVVDHPQAAEEDAATLSGGQMVRASMSLRFALMDMFSSNLGLLVLDEPTTFLDAEGREILAQVLNTASGLLRTKGICVVVPTHEPTLTSNADQCIYLGDKV